ncbi:Hypothetical predicted protein [Cloeon dipterum]|uniref:Uncharacterized protein n=1 Tax=Cloeon dipterum TaxID=197152 RepID=A0A8S1CRE5_9INSE|nr:Hypothetical predicted protein [Cloeon dipterum]
MVNFNESPMHLAKLLGWRESTRTYREAWNWVLRLFQAPNSMAIMERSIQFLEPNLRRTVLLQLLRTTCLRLDRNDEDIKTVMRPALVLLMSLHVDVDVLDMTGFASFSPKAKRYRLLQGAINMVSIHATDLEAFSVLREESSRECVPEEQVLSPFCTQAFIRLESLQMLRMEVFDFGLMDLMLVCERLTKLRYLSVNIENEFELPTVERLKKSFHRLTAFFFQSAAAVERIELLKNLCKIHLPKLQVIGNFASVFCSQNNYHFSPHQVEGRNLRHLTLNLQYVRTGEEVHLMFPNVTHLMITGSDSSWEVQPLLLFSNIESLHLSLVSSEAVLNFLTTYGPDLHSLYLAEFISDLSLDQIFSLCPRLERIGLFIEDPEVPVNSLPLLKEVMLKSVTVSNILNAPNLQKVTLNEQCVNNDDLRMVTDLINTGQVLRKVETIAINLHCHTVEEISRLYFDAVVDFIVTAAVKLPKLSDIQFKINHLSDYLTLAESVTHGKLINEEISGVDKFFKNVIDVDSLSWFVDDRLVTTLNKFKTA